jgi:hypothetical protein
MTAQILLAWLKLLALEGDLAKAEPKSLRYRVLHAAARLVHGGRRRRLKIQATWPWAAAITAAWQRIDGSRKLPDQHEPSLRSRKENPGRGTPGHPARRPGRCRIPALKSRPQRGPERRPTSAINPDERSGLAFLARPETAGARTR